MRDCSKSMFVVFAAGARTVAWVASVSVLFRSEERPRNGILGFGRARSETRPTLSLLFYFRAIFRAVFDSRSSFFAPKPHGNACYAGYKNSKNASFRSIMISLEKGVST